MREDIDPEDCDHDAGTYDYNYEIFCQRCHAFLRGY